MAWRCTSSLMQESLRSAARCDLLGEDDLQERVARLEQTARDLNQSLISLNHDCVVNGQAVSRVDDMIRGDGHQPGLADRVRAVERISKIGAWLAGTVTGVVVIEVLNRLTELMKTP